MTAYYNEFDPKAAAWLRELIKAGHIAPGHVDERSILDVRPSDLDGFTQCHFFAGIGVWSYALRRAGWRDDRPVWTGSCPCQPFSAAGRGNGFADERHLWPALLWLIKERRPCVVLGEQVASKDGLAWLDLVQADMEGEGYALGALDFCSAGVGAPHIRQRLYWSAEGLEHAESNGREQRRAEPGRRSAISGRQPSGLGDDDCTRREGDGLPTLFGGGDRRRSVAGASGSSTVSGVGYGLCEGLEGHGGNGSKSGEPRRLGSTSSRPTASAGAVGGLDDRTGPGPVNGFWRAADWLFCRDEKWRPVEPGTFPLADGAPARVGRLRGYGNAINAEAATAFVEAYLEAERLRLTQHPTVFD